MPDSDVPSLLTYNVGAPFATGSSRFLDARPGRREPHPRIYVKFHPAGIDVPFLALLDTGAHFCILEHEIVDFIEDGLTERLDELTLQTAYGLMQGELYIYPIVLLAEEGEHLEVDMNVFISQAWRGPSFLGYSRAMEHSRFAIDPPSNRYYFGPLNTA